MEGDGQLLGNIQPVRKGTKGFGYDSIFYANPLKSTVAEADQELVAKINHRAQAVEMVINKFKDHLNGVAPSA